MLANRNPQYTLHVMRMALDLCGLLPPQKSQPQNNKKSISYILIPWQATKWMATVPQNRQSHANRSKSE